MNAPWSPEVLLRPTAEPGDASGQAPLPLGTDGVARWVWEGRFGAMLIEVRDGAVFVNGQHVQPHPGPQAGAMPPGSLGPEPGAGASATTPAHFTPDLF